MSCRRSGPIREWKCSCSILWHLCADHLRKREKLHVSPTCEARTGDVHQKVRPKRKWNALLNNGSYDRILKDDIERVENHGKSKRCSTEHDQTVIVLGHMQSSLVPIRFLSAALAQRFPSCTSSC